MSKGGHRINKAVVSLFDHNFGKDLENIHSPGEQLEGLSDAH